MEPDKRQHIRKRTDQLLYAEFGAENGSILLNLSEEGCSFQSIAPVRSEHVRFSVSVGDGYKLEGDGQMVWSDTKKKTGGVRFLNPSRELREQVRAWLDQTLVTTGRKLDPTAVESEAKRRRRKLREEARAEAARARKEAARKESRTETPGEDDRPAQQARPPNDPSTKETPNPITGADSTAGFANSNSAVTLRRTGTIAVGVLLFMTLATYRRELGHLVMSVGSSIAGEKGGTAAPGEPRPAPIAANSEVKAAAMPEAHDTASESSSDASDSGSGGETASAELTRPGEVQATASAKRFPTRQERAVEDASSLWMSVENGDTGAEVTLAGRYVRGEGVPQSCAQARVLLEAAIKRGRSEAKQKLGELGQAGCP
jgi:PilZ domain